MSEPKFRMVLVRHGESEWNLKKIVTGWYDTKLSERGTHEAIAAGKAIRKANFQFDVAITSLLSTATETLRIILEELDQPDLPVLKSWRMNERHFGALTGLNEDQASNQYNGDDLEVWKNSFDGKPPPMEQNHPYFEIITRDNRYRGQLTKDTFPKTESFQDTVDRVLYYWKKNIMQQLMMRKSVLIVGHTGPLKALIKILEDVSDVDIVNINVPNGVPFVYELDCKFKPMGPMKFLGDEITVRKAIEMVGPIATSKT